MRGAFEYAWGVPRPAVLACAAASVLAARLAAAESVAPCLVVAWFWVVWLGLRPLTDNAIRRYRRRGVLRWAMVPLWACLAWWAAVWTGAFDRVLTIALPLRYVQRMEDDRAGQARVLASIRESLRRSARAAREGAME